MASISGRTGSKRGHDRTGRRRSEGHAFCNAWRTRRRWTPNCRATPAMVPIPNSYSRRICSNSSTFCLRFIMAPLLPENQVNRVSGSNVQVGQFRLPKCPKSDYRTHETLAKAYKSQGRNDTLAQTHLPSCGEPKSPGKLGQFLKTRRVTGWALSA